MADGNGSHLIDVKLRILRFNPEKDKEAHFEEYTVEADPMERLLDLLHKVKWYQDTSLSVRRSCAHGICGSDAMVINGRNALACKVLVKDLKQPITVEPIRGLPVMRDLIVDMEPFFAGYKAVKPWLITPVEERTPAHERLQSPEERERYDDTTKCILCAACTTSCPIFWADEEYVGPAAIVNAHRFIFDSRDTGARERLEILSQKDGAFKCRTAFNCTYACPRGIKVTQAINEVKRAALFDTL
ncbi:MAG: succinate dehydrogenase / fumarate reductase, iron-sulfur subunit [Actinomycetota bacterium]|jgi:succinate dehydrogenase / fumarate reductase iron-sulfur subunit|nr:succinate dehydrogenase / fumarate reductase, iron-sulfur subunit [Actinomycetota bacterium]